MRHDNIFAAALVYAQNNHVAILRLIHNRLLRNKIVIDAFDDLRAQIKQGQILRANEFLDRRKSSRRLLGHCRQTFELFKLNTSKHFKNLHKKIRSSRISRLLF